MVAGAPVAVVIQFQLRRKSSFDIVLTSAGEKKIEVIKVVRDLTQRTKRGQGLSEVAKGPQTIKEGVEKKEAEEIKQKFVMLVQQ